MKQTFETYVIERKAQVAEYFAEGGSVMDREAGTAGRVVAKC
jgi:hypothetical protein